MEEKLTELPKGWIWVKLGEILEPSTKKVNPLTIEEMKYIGLEHIEKDKGTITGYGSSKEVKSTKSYFNKGDLLYGKLRPYLNKVYIAEFEGVCSSDILVFPISKNLNNKYLLYIFLNKDFSRYANLQVSGVQHPRTSFKSISKYVFPMPPLPEQHRIVEKIEELFSRLDAGIESLKKVQTQIKRYRQAVLKHAFEGKLTAAWRETNKHRLEPASVIIDKITQRKKKNATGKQKELSELYTSYLPELPNGWEWVKVKDIGETVTGNTPSKKNNDYYSNEYPFFKPTDLNSGYYVKEAADGLSKKGISRARLLPAKSILVTCIGATIGKAGLIRVPGASNQQINAIIPYKPLIPEYLYFICTSPQFQKCIHDNASSTTLPILNKSKFENLIIPLPSIEEQQKIVEEIERRFSIADRVEEIVEQNLKKAERLRQSILKKAFEGKLVPQDPTDEPASVLLERIKAEKEKNANKKDLCRRSKK